LKFHIEKPLGLGAVGCNILTDFGSGYSLQVRHKSWHRIITGLFASIPQPFNKGNVLANLSSHWPTASLHSNHQPTSKPT